MHIGFTNSVNEWELGAFRAAKLGGKKKDMTVKMKRRRRSKETIIICMKWRDKYGNKVSHILPTKFTHL
jgi:hypothetical protein